MPSGTSDAWYTEIARIFQDMDDAFIRFRPQYIVRTDYSRRIADVKVKPEYL